MQKPDKRSISKPDYESHLRQPVEGYRMLKYHWGCSAGCKASLAVLKPSMLLRISRKQVEIWFVLIFHRCDITTNKDFLKQDNGQSDGILPQGKVFNRVQWYSTNQC